jgi:hypothetical protein
MRPGGLNSILNISGVQRWCHSMNLRWSTKDSDEKRMIRDVLAGIASHKGNKPQSSLFACSCCIVEAEAVIPEVNRL